jgi:phage anti-repressor protein
MSQLNFDLSTANLLLDSSEQFPVDFDRAWQWLGFARKDPAKTSLLNSGFNEGVDYTISLHNNMEADNHAALSIQQKGSRSKREAIWLTIDCFKTWGMMARSEQGKKVREYFLECERIAKAKSSSKTSNEALLEAVQKLVEQDRRLTVVEERSTQTENRIANLEYYQQDALNSLNELPEPTCLAQPLTVRFALHRLVRGYATSNSLLLDGCYRQLHREFRDRYHIDLIARGKNQKPKISGVEFAEQRWLIDHLYSVAVELFGADRTPSFPYDEV